MVNVEDLSVGAGSVLAEAKTIYPFKASRDRAIRDMKQPAVYMQLDWEPKK